MTTTLEYERTGRQCEALRIVFRFVHTESGLMLFSLIGWEFPDHQAREFTPDECFNPPLEPSLPVLDGRFRLFALILSVSPQKLC